VTRGHFGKSVFLSLEEVSTHPWKEFINERAKLMGSDTFDNNNLWIIYNINNIGL
jgi:hypothetical protein